MWNRCEWCLPVLSSLLPFSKFMMRYFLSYWSYVLGKSSAFMSKDRMETTDISSVCARVFSPCPPECLKYWVLLDMFTCSLTLTLWMEIIKKWKRQLNSVSSWIFITPTASLKNAFSHTANASVKTEQTSSSLYTSLQTLDLALCHYLCIIKSLHTSEINEQLVNENSSGLITARCSSAVIMDWVFQSCTPSE